MQPNNTFIYNRLVNLYSTVKSSIFRDIIILPKDVTFESRDTDENVFMVVRAHAFTNFGWIFATLFFSLMPIWIGPIIGFIEFIFTRFQVADIDVLSYFNFSRTLAAIAFLYSIVFFTATWSFLSWYYNILLVTNKRILDYDFEPMGKNKVAEAPLVCIEDISQTITGLWPSVFNYGNVTVQTAANHNNFFWADVPRPSMIRDKIMDMSQIIQNKY